MLRHGRKYLLQAGPCACLCAPRVPFTRSITVSIQATNLGFPRIGAQRELKSALEGYWRGQCSREQLLATGAQLRARHWRLQQAAGLDHIPSNDFSFYDHMLDLSCMLGCVPPRY